MEITIYMLQRISFGQCAIANACSLCLLDHSKAMQANAIGNMDLHCIGQDNKVGENIAAKYSKAAYIERDLNNTHANITAVMVKHHMMHV